MNQIMFYNMEKQTEKSCYRLSIMAGTSFEDAIAACQEFIAKLQEDMAAAIARKELEDKKAAEAQAPVEAEVITPELTE